MTAAVDLSDVFPYIGGLWERALKKLMPSLTAAERHAGKAKMAAWDVELSEYGVEETFTDAMAIL